MLIENWDYYHESNMTLKNLLMKTDMSPPECADFYYEHMKNRESVTYDRSYIISKFYNKKSKRGKLREINQVVISKPKLCSRKSVVWNYILFKDAWF